MSANQTTTTRRRVLQTSALAALAGSLLGVTSPPTVDAQTSTAPPQIVLGGLADESRLAAASSAAVAESRAATDAYLEISDAFEATLTADQLAQFKRVESAFEELIVAGNEFEWAEVKRHLPGLAITIDVLRFDGHIGWLDKAGHCCRRGYGEDGES
jgi:hypothetical protein